jgi:Flp pilus assembly protein TadG
MECEHRNSSASEHQASRNTRADSANFFLFKKVCLPEHQRCMGTEILQDRRGSVAIVSSLIAFILFDLAGIAIDYSMWTNHKHKLQNAVDAAALAAAGELRFGTVDKERVNAIAVAIISSVYEVGKGSGAVSVDATLNNDRRSVTISASQQQQMIISQVISSAPATINVSASASLSGTMTLCLLTLEPTVEKAILLTVNSRIDAPECDTQANSASSSAVFTGGNAGIDARLTCAAGGFGGTVRIMGERNSDSPVISDPLASRPPPPVEGCKPNNQPIVNRGNVLLTPGTYCGGIRIGANSEVVFQPGVYVIKDGPFVIEANAGISGTGVGFYFVGDAGQTTVFSASPQSSIDLSAPVNGPLAGILFFEDRAAPLLRVFEILSDRARNLLGTFYVPNGQFSVRSGTPVGDKSAFTVIVARRVDLSGSPRLTLNANYGDTDVPVPEGVGPRGKTLLYR